MRLPRMTLDQVPMREWGVPVVTSDGSLSWTKDASGAGDMILAHHAGIVLGVLAYHLSRRRCFEILAVWTAPPFRREGLARRLFRLAVDIERLRSVKATVISESGAGFLKWVRASFAGPVRITRFRPRWNPLDRLVEEIYGLYGPEEARP